MEIVVAPQEINAKTGMVIVTLMKNVYQDYVEITTVTLKCLIHLIAVMIAVYQQTVIQQRQNMKCTLNRLNMKGTTKWV